jgi:hypothetical protein
MDDLRVYCGDYVFFEKSPCGADTDWRWLRRKIAEKFIFTNAITVRVCPKVTSARGHLLKKPCIYEIMRKSGHGMPFS